MNPHDLLWLAALGMGAWNAWLTRGTRNEILTLKLDLVERIAKVEGDVKALKATRGWAD